MSQPFRPGVRRSTVTALAVVAAVLAAAAGLFVALYLMERADIGELDRRLAETERGLDREGTRLSTSQSTVDDLDAERDELEAALTELRACADPSRASIDAVQAGDDAGLDAAIGRMLAHCGR